MTDSANSEPVFQLSGEYLFSRKKSSSWKAKCPIFKAIVAGFRGKVDGN